MIEAVNRTAAPFAEAKNQIEELNKATAQASTLVFAEQRAQNFLIATYRQKYRAVYDTLGLMRSVGTIGNQIISIVNAQNIAQIRLRDSLIDVEDAQLRLNTAIGLFGEDSVQYEAALDDLEKAQNRYADAANDEKWKDLGIAASLVGMTAQVGTLILRLGEIPGAWATITSLTPIVLPITVTLLGMATALEAIEYLKTTAQVAAGEVAPGGTAPDFPAGYIPDEYLDIGETTGFDPIPAEIPFDPYAEDWAGGVMRPEDYEPGFGTPRPDDLRGLTWPPDDEFAVPARDVEDEAYSRAKDAQAAAYAKAHGTSTTTNIEVNVETNADPERIADEIAWRMRRHNREDW